MVQIESRKFSQWFLKGLLKWYDGGGENEITSKRIFKVEVYFSSQNVNFPFIWREFWSFSFFLFLSISLFSDIWGGNHFFKNLFSIGFNILAVDAYSGVELCTPTWLIYDYGDGAVVDILAVDAYSRMDVCTPIFMGEASK
jgi:hypothetical protein